MSDLEFSKPANPQIEPNQIEILLNELIAELCTDLLSAFNIAISRKDIVDLESSTEKKFSRHFIVHFPDKRLFADAIECGAFVKSFVGRLAEEVATGKLQDRSPVLAQCFFVHSQVSNSAKTPSSITSVGKSSTNEAQNRGDTAEDHTLSKLSQPQPYWKEASLNSKLNNNKGKTCFIDTGVYTRNRIFRLMGSVKYGKPMSAALRVSSTNQFPLGGYFGNTLSFSSSSEPNESNRISEDDLEKHATALADTFVVPINYLSANKGILPKISTDNKFDAYFRRKAPTLKRSNGVSQQNTIGHSSPFPALDQFVTNNLGIRGGTQGHIRACEIGYETPIGSYLSHCILTYQMKGNRWCENINRSHKSNNIMWIVSIQRMQYWQGCYGERVVGYN